MRVWKVTEYDVTLDANPGDDIHAQAIAMAEQGHTTDSVDRVGVVDKGTSPIVRRITAIKNEGSEQ